MTLQPMPDHDESDDRDLSRAYALLDKWGGESIPAYEQQWRDERPTLLALYLAASACTRGWRRFYAERAEKAAELALREREVAALEASVAAGLRQRHLRPVGDSVAPPGAS